MKMIYVKRLMKGEYTVSDVMNYFIGMSRYQLYTYLPFLVMPYIRKQIELRFRMMDKDCYNNGSCKLCGCEVPHLQMANKSCDKPCYPPIMSRYDWKHFKVEVDSSNFTLVMGCYFTKDGVWTNCNDADTPFKDVELIKFRKYVERN